MLEDYNRFVNMTDDEFLENLNHAAHFACIIMWFKERGQRAIADDGIVHELIHLMCNGTTNTLKDIREQFKTELYLS